MADPLSPSFLHAHAPDFGGTFSIALVAWFLVVCGSQEPGNRASKSTLSETGTESEPQIQSEPQIPHPCPGGETRPLDIQTVIEIARRHGITLYSDPQCIGDPTVERQASNAIAYGPNKNVDRYDEITQREGHVTCLLYAQQSRDQTVRRVRYPGEEETNFTLLNVLCVIYPEPANAKKQRRLQETMDELQQRSRISS